MSERSQRDPIGEATATGDREPAREDGQPGREQTTTDRRPIGGRSVPVAAEPPGYGPPADLLAAAQRLFSDRLPLAIEYARLLSTDGVVRGLIGPREAPRIWDRHLLNCATVAELISPAASVVDVGSGAGLPGIVLAMARPDLSVILVEPLARRTAFLAEVVTALGLDRITVVRARAEECVGRNSPVPAQADVVTARALAPLDRLSAWCLPLAAEGGRVLALKGESAREEIAEHREAIARLGGAEPTVRLCGAGLIDPPTTVVEIVRLGPASLPRPASTEADRLAAKPTGGPAGVGSRKAVGRGTGAARPRRSNRGRDSRS